MPVSPNASALINPPESVRNRLAKRLGRRPTVAETKAEALRILDAPDPANGGLFTADAVRSALMNACIEAGSQKAWAAKAGISEPYLSSVLSGLREPGDSILAALGMVRKVWYVENR